MYLPCWTDGLSFREQHDVYWIANEYEKSQKQNNDTSFYSFLPLRLYLGVYHNEGFYDLHSVGTYQNGFELRRSSEIRNSNLEFALQVWEKAAEIIKKEYPEIEIFSYDDQLLNGVYPIHWACLWETIKTRQVEIINQIINSGFTVDEYLTVSLTQNGNIKDWNYKGIVGVSYAEFRNLFYNTPHGEIMPVELKKRVSYSYEQCTQYYRLFDERMIQLGNQVRVYQKVQNTNDAFFKAIKEKDVVKIKEYIEDGYSLNAIGANGDSAFSKILSGLLDDEAKQDWDDIDENKADYLDYLFSHGANPAIYGVNSFSNNLVEAAVYHRNKLAEWLLKKGVNPAIYPHIDDLCDEDVTLIDWLEDILYEEMHDNPDCDCDDVKDLIRILKEHF